MIVNAATLRGVFVSFNTIFNQALKTAKPNYEKVATVVTSTADTETYAWLGDIPGMREWIGDRVVHNLTASGYALKNKHFELTVGIDRDAIADDKLGLYKPSIQMIGREAALHPDKLVFGLLSDGFTTHCFDGKPFYATDHPVGDKKASNKMTEPLSAASYSKARASMRKLKNAKGEALALVPNLLVVPPALEETAKQIVEAEYVNGSKNTLRGTAEVHVEPRLKTDTEWHLLCTEMPVKPLIYQEREKAKLVPKTASTDDNVFYNKEFVYGADSRGNAGYGLWQMAVGSTGAGT